MFGTRSQGYTFNEDSHQWISEAPVGKRGSTIRGFVGRFYGEIGHVYGGWSA